MKKTCYCFLLLLWCTLHARADLRSDLQAYGLRVGQDFYVMMVNLNISSNSNACVVYTIYQNIRKQSHCKDVVFVFRKEGYNQAYIIRYMREVMKIDSFPHRQAKLCISDAIYDRYKKFGWYSEIIYFSNRIRYHHPAKFIDLTKLKTLPYSRVKMEYTGAVMLDTNYLHTRRDLFCASGQHAIQVSDGNGYRIGTVDHTGQLDHVCRLDTLESPIELYKRFRHPSAADVEIAIQYNDYKAINRPELSPMNLFASGSQVYLPFALGVMERIKKAYALSGGGSAKKELKKGSIQGNLYLFMMRFDPALGRHEVIDLSAPLDNMYHHDILGFEDIYTPDDTLFYICHEYDEAFKNQWYNRQIISRHRLSGSQLIFEKSINIPHVPATQHLIGNNFFTAFKGDLLLSRLASKDLYSVTREVKVAELSGLPENKERKETYPMYIDDTAAYNLAFEVLAAKNIDDRYYAVVYKNFGSVLVEIFDDAYQSVQLLQAPIHDDNQVGGYFMQGNDLMQLKFTNGKAYLLKYTISVLE